MHSGLLRFLATLATDSVTMSAYLADPQATIAAAGLSANDAAALESGDVADVINQVMSNIPVTHLTMGEIKSVTIVDSSCRETVIEPGPLDSKAASAPKPSSPPRTTPITH